ncbi:karyopherin [Coemansia asiatica]|uniref:Karyopherin n=1 Tax=Coemansia asiatica TaxID=1052880 RepID=A0A9W7XSN2_9FUNG|nr:karyopherin [Coemansia asiatica]
MDQAVIQRVLNALELVYSVDTPAEQRRQAEEFCQQLRNDQSSSTYGVHLATKANGYPPTTRHFGLQLIEHSISNNRQQDIIAVRESLWNILWHQNMDEPLYIREKLVAIVVQLVIRLWPSAEWPDLSQQLMQMWGVSETHRETVLRIWRTLGEEMFVFDRDAMVTVRKHELTNGIVGALLPRPVIAQLYPGGYRLSTEAGGETGHGGSRKKKKATAIPVEPGNEGGWLYRWTQNAIELATAFNGSNEPLLLSLISTISTFMDWVPVKALRAMDTAGRLAQLLQTPSDQVRIQALGALEIISRRSSGTGDERDIILLQFAQDHAAAALYQLAQCYATTLDGESQWADASEALAAAKTISQVASNLVNLHWARKKTETNVLGEPQMFLELLLKLSQDPRFTVSTMALNSWAAIIKHDILSKTPAVAVQFSALTEYTTKTLFDVCRVTQQLASVSGEPSAAIIGINEDEIEQFETIGELRMFLTNDVRTRLLAIIRGMCALDPAGFVGWIMPSLAPVFSQHEAPTAVIEAALMIVDSILSTLDDFEQRVLADDDSAQLGQVERARQLCYQLGTQVVGYATADLTLVSRQLQTLPSFAFLLRPSLMDNEKAQELLLAVLRKCIGHLKFSAVAPGPLLRDLRQIARRATSALVGLALAIPDSLMRIYGDLSQMVAARLADPEVAITVKSYLSEFQLALVAGASCTVTQRKQLAMPVVQPIVATLGEFMQAFQTPQAFVEFLGLPALDNAYAAQMVVAEDVRRELNGARDRRNQLTHTLSTLHICLQRTLLGAGNLNLASVWADYVGHLAPAILLLVRCLHALWNPAHRQTMGWQSAQARDNLFGVLEMSQAERLMITGGEPLIDQQGSGDVLLVEIRAVHHALATIRDHAYRALGRLMALREMLDQTKLPGLAANFTGCVFADVAVLEPRHWRLLLTEVVRPTLENVGNWPGITAQKIEKEAVGTLAQFLPAWLPPLFDFCTSRLHDEWMAMSELNSGDERVDDAMVHEKMLRDWTRAWSHVLADLLGSLSLWIPEAARMLHDISHAARISSTHAVSSPGVSANCALGLFVLQSSEQILAHLLTAALRLLRFAKDTQSVDRVLAAISELAPAFVLLVLAPKHQPPTPAHASTATAYSSRIAAGSLAHNSSLVVADSLDHWLTAELVPALLGVLRDAYQIDSQDAALAVLADVIYFSAAFTLHVQPAWTPRNSSGANEMGDPGSVLRLKVLRAMGAEKNSVDFEQEEEEEQPLQKVAGQVLAEDDSRRRKALLRVALLPVLAVEKSRMFGNSESKLVERKKATGVSVPENWTNRSMGTSDSLVDCDERFDLAALIP